MTVTPIDFVTAFKTHSPGITRYAERRLNHFVDYEDVVQETFLQAWKIWDQRTSNNVRAWLIGIAQRVYWHMRRGELIRPTANAMEYNAEKDERIVEPTQELAQYIMQLRDKFACMGPAQAAVMNALADGWSVPEIAQDRGTSRQAVNCSIALARKHISTMET